MTDLGEWEAIYSTGNQINSWPWSDLVSLYFQYKELLELKGKPPRVLELGLGTGNNIPFWKSLQSDYSGMDISAKAIEISLERFPDLNAKLKCGDFSLIAEFSGEFDLIFDRASLTHGNNYEVQEAISASFNSMKSGGLYIGIDWFSRNHSDSHLPSVKIDSNTRTGFKLGQFTNVGKTNFSDRARMLQTFADFEILYLKEKIITNQYPDQGSHQFASWNVVARKPL